MDDFAAAARRLAALSARMLGWAPDTFWNATPEELAASLGESEPAIAPPSRAELEMLIERDRNGR